MKSLVCAIILLCTIIITTLFIGVYTECRLVDFINLINVEISGDASNVYVKAKEIECEYDNIKTYLILFMQKSDVREIETHISDMKSAAESEDIPGIITAKNRLILHIEQLRRLSTFSFEAIF